MPTSPLADGATGVAGWGVMLPSFDPYRAGTPPLVEAAQHAERLGFDSGWVGDHLAFHAPVLEATVAAAAAAAVTTRLRIGFGIMLLALRHPVWAAKQLATLEALAPGRMILGVGVGGENEAEFEAAGVPLARRGARLEESLSVVGRLLRGESVDQRGPIFTVRSPALAPVPGEMLPLVVGGRSPAALARAGRVGDAWLGVWLDPERVRRAREEIARAAETADRPPPQTMMMVFVNVSEESGAREETAQLVMGQYGLPLERFDRWIPVGGVDQVASELANLRAVGVDGFVLVPAARDPIAQYERFAEVRALLDDPVSRPRSSALGGHE